MRGCFPDGGGPVSSANVETCWCAVAGGAGGRRASWGLWKVEELHPGWAAMGRLDVFCPRLTKGVRKPGVRLRGPRKVAAGRMERAGEVGWGHPRNPSRG